MEKDVTISNVPNAFKGSSGMITPHPQSGATYADYSRVKKCPLWALVHRLDGKSVGASDRCNPGCQLYVSESGDCALKVIARRLAENAAKG